MDKDVLVCVIYYKNAENLIKKGTSIAKAYGGTCYVLTIYDETDNKRTFERTSQEDIIEDWAKRFDVKKFDEPLKGRKISTIICLKVKEHQCKHILIAQPVQSKWDMLIHGSIINELFEKLSNVDVTIIEVNRKNIIEDSEYQSGIHAFLSKNEEGYYLTYQNSAESVMEGIFYQNQKTDFETGIFKSIDKDNIHLINVCEGMVNDDQSDEIKKLL